MRRMIWPVRVLVIVCMFVGSGACRHNDATSTASDAATLDHVPSTVHLPLVLVADAPLPGNATRFDYQDVDSALQHLVVAHMSDNAVLIVNLRNGALLKQLSNIPTPRGISVAADVGIVFVTSMPDQLVLIDSKSLTEVRRVTTGNAPDGVAWDPVHKTVGISDQGDGALSLIPEAGAGQRIQVRLGTETGNVTFDAHRNLFWITVVAASPPDQLIAVDPTSAQVVTTVPLPGCSGAHGLRLHPDAQSAFIACESNDVLTRVALESPYALESRPTGSGPDVLAIDPGLGWLYVAAESGDLTVFDVNQPGVALVGHDSPGSNSHSVAVDPSSHRVFFPLVAGSGGTPVLRIMRPTGT